MKTFLIGTGVIFWVVFVIACGFGLYISILEWREFRAEREQEEERLERYLIDERNVVALPKDAAEIVDILKEAEEKVNAARDLAKEKRCMTITLESKFSDVLTELDRIRKTFEDV